MNTLGLPDEYEVFIVDSLTQETVDVVPWTSIAWQRTRNQASTATVTCARQQSIRPKWFEMSPLTAWSKMMVIIRNGFRVWDGPVLDWSAGASLTITARDRSVALNKRLQTSTIDLSTGGPYSMYTNLIAPAISGSGLQTAGVGQMPYSILPSAVTSTVISDVLDPRPNGVWRFEQMVTLQSLFEQLADSAFLCWTQINRDLYIYLDRLEQFLTLRPEYIVSPTGDIGVTVRGGDLATGVYKGDTGQGIVGFPNPVLARDVQTYIPYGLYGTLADTKVAGFEWWSYDASSGLSTPADPQQFVDPAPTITLEDVILGPDFVLADSGMLTSLIPGAIVALDFPDSWALNTPIVQRRPTTNPLLGSQNLIETNYSPRVQYARLEQVDVEATKDKETVKVSLTAWATS